MPTNFAIFANTEELERLYQKALKYGIMERPNRWNLIYLDFLTMFQRKQSESVSAELRQFQPNSVMCCTYLGLNVNEPCECSNGISVEWFIIFNLKQTNFK